MRSQYLNTAKNHHDLCHHRSEFLLSVICKSVDFKMLLLIIFIPNDHDDSYDDDYDDYDDYDDVDDMMMTVTTDDDYDGANVDDDDEDDDDDDDDDANEHHCHYEGLSHERRNKSTLITFFTRHLLTSEP